MSSSKTLHRLAHGAKFLVPVIVAVFVGRVIYGNWQQIQDADWDIAPLYLLGSAALCSVWFWVRPLGWNLLVNGFGRTIPFPAVFRVVRQAELSRFIPGGVWHFASRVYLIKQWKVSASSALAATVVDLILTTLAAFIPALWSLSSTFPELGGRVQMALMVFPLISVVLVHPKVFNLWAGMLFRRLGQRYVKLDVHWGRLLGIWAMYVGAWSATCLGVALFIRGVIALGPGGTTFMGSSYAVAWLVGTFAVISPAGMGIREGALGLLLAQWMPEGPAFAIAVGIRLWLLLIEVGWVLVAMLLPRPEPPTAIDADS